MRLPPAPRPSPLLAPCHPRRCHPDTGANAQWHKDRRSSPLGSSSAVRSAVSRSSRASSGGFGGDSVLSLAGAALVPAPAAVAEVDVAGAGLSGLASPSPAQLPGAEVSVLPWVLGPCSPLYLLGCRRGGGSAVRPDGTQAWGKWRGSVASPSCHRALARPCAQQVPCCEHISS